MRGSSMRKLTRYIPAANPQQIGATARKANRAAAVGAQTAPATEMAVANIRREAKNTVDARKIRPSSVPTSGVPSDHVTRPLRVKGVCQKRTVQSLSQKTISRSLTILNLPRGVV